MTRTKSFTHKQTFRSIDELTISFFYLRIVIMGKPEEIFFLNFLLQSKFKSFCPAMQHHAILRCHVSSLRQENNKQADTFHWAGKLDTIRRDCLILCKNQKFKIVTSVPVKTKVCKKFTRILELLINHYF
jgi:hypothetical protein